MKSICVYCGSSPGASEIYASGARDLARVLVAHQISLVYGGGSIGLMGILADEVLRLGGHVIGVIPKALMDKELGHTQLSKLHIVQNMHQRKALMSELSDGFIALPGGIGTLEELFEMFTWLQLGIHNKPLGILNINGFYDQLIEFLKHTVKTKFLASEQLDLLIKETDPELLLQSLSNFHYTQIKKGLHLKDS
ncbi:LOG family protein [Undibacterium parvum]|uniref:Cytokinin riboside 5'-monophosphate phosphoribohydrolase n=1 Tax=Undibacterium parvum TaxID=401471 RepID=A0A3S9HQ71_9BURK|nr:TIGR00730 family Rossman fold protein [Undibacterium parvum]AZP14225.1 TIGR00730 family Rossman fold protein [Undibacterium parvum]